MATPAEIARLNAQLDDLDHKTGVLLGATTGTRRGPAAKAAALSGYLSAIDGKGPSSYDDLVKQQTADDAKATLAAQQKAKADQIAAERQQKLDDTKAERDWQDKRDNRKLAQERELAKAKQAQDEADAAKKQQLPPAMRGEMLEAEKTLGDIDTFEAFIDDPKNAKQVELYTPAVKANADAMRSSSIVERGMGNVNPFTGSDQDVEDSSQMFAMAEQIYAPIRKGMFGVVLTKSDLERAAQNQPAPGDSKQRLKTKIAVLRELTAKGLRLMKEVADAQGYNTAGYGLKLEATRPATALEPSPVLRYIDDPADPATYGAR